MQVVNAVANGYTGAAIQAAIDAAAGKPDQVYIPAGKYVVSETIRVPAGIQLRGDGMYATVLLFNDNGICLDLRHDAKPNSNCIRDLSVIGNSEPSSVGVHCENKTYNTVLDNVLIDRFGRGLILDRSWTVTVRNCQISACKEVCVRIIDSPTVTLIANRIMQGGLEAEHFDVEHGHNVVALGNCHNLHFVGNNIQFAERAGVYIRGPVGVHFFANYFEDNYREPISHNGEWAHIDIRDLASQQVCNISGGVFFDNGLPHKKKRPNPMRAIAVDTIKHVAIHSIYVSGIYTHPDDEKEYWSHDQAIWLGDKVRSALVSGCVLYAKQEIKYNSGTTKLIQPVESTGAPEMPHQH